MYRKGCPWNQCIKYIIINPAVMDVKKESDPFPTSYPISVISEV
jgi:hypothetical protein